MSPQNLSIDDKSSVKRKKTNSRIYRIITGSYEHNLFCVALNLNETKVIFNPVFHFKAHTQSIRCLARTGRFLVSGSNDELIRLYDLQKRRESGTLMHHTGAVICLKFFKKKWLFSGSDDGHLLIWRCKDWEVLAELKGHKAAVSDIDIHPTGRVALSVGEDRKLILWNLMTARKVSVMKLRGNPRKVCWVPNSSNFIIGFDTKIIEYTDSKPSYTLELTSPMHQMRFHKFTDHTHLIVSTEDGKILFYNSSDASFSDPKLDFMLIGHTKRVKDFDILDNIMVSASSDGQIVVWDLEKKDQIAVYNENNDRLNCILIAPDDIETNFEDHANQRDIQADSYSSAAPEKSVKRSRK